MANPEKVAAVAELAERIGDSNGVVLTEYRGLSVEQMQQLRRTLDGNVEYAVVKNTLTKRAAEQAGLAELDSDLLVGPSALAFVTGDPVEAAKGLRDFSEANPELVIKGGVLEGRSVTVSEIERLADLESREGLLAKVAGTLQAPLSNAASLLSAPLGQTARLAEALRAKVEQQGGSSADT